MRARLSPYIVVLIGPDGSGKSTVARALLEAEALPFARRVLVRWSLGVLPPPDRAIAWFEQHIYRIPEPDAQHMGMRLALPIWQSVLITAYFALDMWLGRWRLRQARGQRALFVFDRSFYDYYVLMGHRRLPRWYLRTLERLVPRPDLILHVRRDPATIYRDKAELTREEIERQQQVIDTLLRGYRQAHVVDGNHGVAAAVANAVAHVQAIAPLVAEPRPSVVARLRACAEAYPDRVAIERGDDRVTYRTLVEAGDRVAHALRARGVRPGVTVAVHGQRSVGLVAAVLGVWRVGATVLVLDPALPVARRTHLAAHAVVHTWVRVGTDEVPGDRSAPVSVDASTGCPIGADAPVGPLVDDPTGAAYICFTSGSTGTPKGVVGTHEGLAHFIDWQGTRFGVGPEDRVAHLTHVMFDVVWRDLWLPLTTGGTLIVPERDDDRPDRVLAWLGRCRATVVHAVPSLTQVWLATPSSGDALTTLRYTFFAGEPLPDRLVTAWRQRCPRTTVVNLYGPTETTLAKCASVVPTPPRDGVQAVGQPLPGAVVLALDAEGRCVPPNTDGELYVRTPYRSRGYLNTGSADTGRFVPNPYTGDADDVWYRTGDIGRYDKDGTVHVRGRVDNQIKIRGVRVEPAEVERAMTDLADVSQAVVLARRDAEGQLQLAAYYTTAAQAAGPSPTSVQRHLETILPLALVPSYVRRLDRLPLTATGKIDRVSLPDPPAPADPAGYRPSDLDETLVAEAWRQVTGLGPTSADADFFTAGGDSLRAVLWSVRLEVASGVAVPLPVLYAERTVSRLAAWLRRVRSGAEAPRLWEMFGGTRPARLYAFPPLLGYGRAYAHLADALPTHAMVAFDFPEIGDPVETYVQAICAMDEGPYTFLGYSAGGNLAFEVAHVLESRGRLVSGIIMLDARRVTQPEVLDAAGLEAVVDGNLAHLSTLLANEPHWSTLLTDTMGRQRLAERLRAFLRYENGRVNAGQVSAPIAYVHSTDVRLSAPWAEATRGGFTVRAGSGRHLEMALGEHARHNGQIVADLLATMVGKGRMAGEQRQGEGQA